jgi:hypothetical protein
VASPEPTISSTSAAPQESSTSTAPYSGSTLEQFRSIMSRLDNVPTRDQVQTIMSRFNELPTKDELQTLVFTVVRDTVSQMLMSSAVVDSAGRTERIVHEWRTRTSSPYANNTAPSRSSLRRTRHQGAHHPSSPRITDAASPSSSSHVSFTDVATSTPREPYGANPSSASGDSD